MYMGGLDRHGSKSSIFLLVLIDYIKCSEFPAIGCSRDVEPTMNNRS